MKATRSTTRLLAGLVGALALFAASCGDDDKDTTATTAPTAAAPGRFAVSGAVDRIWLERDGRRSGPGI